MNKKQFLFLLPICLVICLSLITCEEEEEVFTGNIWVLLRNTVWTKTETITEGNGDKWDAICMIGFYGPNNGPRPSGQTIPYAVIRRIALGKSPDWWEAGEPYFDVYNLQINRNGKTISTEKNGVSFSFNISVSGERLTILNTKDLGYESGTYRKISYDPKYNWNSGIADTLTNDEFNLFMDKYTARYLSGDKIITEIIHLDEDRFQIMDNDLSVPGVHDILDFAISKWEPIDTPDKYKTVYPYAFKITGKVMNAYPQGGGGTPYLYGTKTAPGFTASDLNSTECWMYLYFNYTRFKEEISLIRTAFSKAGNLNENVIIDTNNNLARVYKANYFLDSLEKKDLGDFTSINSVNQKGWCSNGTDNVTTNLTVNDFVDAKYLVLELNAAPAGGLHIVWQSDIDDWDWNQTEILNANGIPYADKGTILDGNIIIIELSKVLKNYSKFVKTRWNVKLLLGYFSPDIAGLGVRGAYFLYE
jgi:hypothetical protein